MVRYKPVFMQLYKGEKSKFPFMLTGRDSIVNG